MGSPRNAVARFDGSPEPHKLVQDRKRYLDHRSKYALGAMVRGDGSPPNQPNLRPVKLATRAVRRPYYYTAYHSKNHPRYAVRDKAILTSDYGCSCDDCVNPTYDVGNAPDAEIAYSFDNTHGPSEGSDILSAAINKAVERFETKEMEKLVKNEYYVLEGKDYEVSSSSGDDDFEWV